MKRIGCYRERELCFALRGPQTCITVTSPSHRNHSHTHTPAEGKVGGTEKCPLRKYHFPLWQPENALHHPIQTSGTGWLFLFFFLISFTFLIKSKKRTKKYIDVLNRTSLCKGLTKQINIGPDKRNKAANSNIIYY